MKLIKQCYEVNNSGDYVIKFIDNNYGQNGTYTRHTNIGDIIYKDYCKPITHPELYITESTGYVLGVKYRGYFL